MDTPDDLLALHGPHHHAGRQAHAPTAPIFDNRLAPHASTHSDDGNRFDESRIASGGLAG